MNFVDNRYWNAAALNRGCVSACSVKRKSQLMEFAGAPRDVADPWYTDDYKTTYEDCLIGCAALLEKILAGKLRRAIE